MRKLKLRRVRIKKYTIISLEKGWIEITGLCYKKEKPIGATKTFLEQFPCFVDSVLFPGLIYNIQQMVGIFGEQETKMSLNVFRLLWFLEGVSGNATKEEALLCCWNNQASDSAIRAAIYATNDFLLALKINSVITSEQGAFCVNK